MKPPVASGMENQAMPSQGEVAEKTAQDDFRAGFLCPKCGLGRLDYDGMLNLVCPNCGLIQGGCFT
jgi:uncharacterized protein (DUF983 family)